MPGKISKVLTRPKMQQVYRSIRYSVNKLTYLHQFGKTYVVVLVYVSSVNSTRLCDTLPRWYSIISHEIFRYLIGGSKRCKNVTIKERIAPASFPVLCQTLFDWPRRKLLIQSENASQMSSCPHALSCLQLGQDNTKFDHRSFQVRDKNKIADDRLKQNENGGQSHFLNDVRAIFLFIWTDFDADVFAVVGKARWRT